MLGPSGFFQTIGDTDLPVSSKDLEIIHDSEAGFNVIYRGNKNGRFFVYKALKKEYRGNPFYEELLKKEFNIGFTLTHSGICQYYGMIDLPDVGNCIVMEWIDGCSLEHLMSQGVINKPLTVKMINELCDALDYMHRKQVVHRDLKPENILITYNGNNVKVIDFGLSDADSYNAFKAPAGTKAYASPELLAGGHIDSRSDIWSLGVIIGELSGRFRHVTAKCMARDRERRYSTAAEVKAAVHSAWRYRMLRALSYAVPALLAAVGLWWLFGNVELQVRDDRVTETEVVMPSDTLAADGTAEMKREAQSLDPEDVMVQEPVMKKGPEHESVSEKETIPAAAEKRKVADERKAAESIDAAALEDLFNEASEMLL